MPDPKLIAFYLPQFHPIPENDAWWGKGFTEWTNVGRARPLFEGHSQPRLPADLGYYDLRLSETREAQAALARQYGIGGFCYYHYWFNGRRLLERPFNEVLASGSPDFPFCLCWANENWTRAWDGLEREVLIRQEYRPDDDLAHIRWLATAFRDRRYIRVDDKPLFLVYRVANLPDPVQTVSLWRDEARKLGLGELFLAAVESRVGGTASIDPRHIGFDATVEFQPDGLHMPKPNRRLNEYGGVFDYAAVVESMLQKPVVPYRRFPCVAPGWDNSARRKNNPTILTGSSPELYERWLKTVIERQAGSGSDPLVFVNAWNEWAEGAYLEPDQISGHAYLEATRRALAAARVPELVTRPDTVAKSEMVSDSQNPEKEQSPSAADKVRLSVCIPVYNGNKYLEEAIASILSQSLTEFELVIVDDNSPEDPAPIVRKFNDPRLRSQRNPTRLGLVGNWNRCLEVARGEFVCLFHQDDVMERDNLRRKVEILERNPSAGLVYSDAPVVEADLSIRHERWFTPTEPNRDTLFNGREFFEKLIAGDNLVCCPSVVIRRACVEQLGKFDPQLPYTADWEMWLRIALHHDVAYLAAPLIQYRVHDANETHRFKGLKELEQSHRAKMLALSRAPDRLPDPHGIRRRCSAALAERALEEMSRLRGALDAKQFKAWLTFATEAHRASLDDASFTAASEWFLTVLERCGASFAGTSGEEAWSDADERQFQQAKQCEANGRADQALGILERLASVRPMSIRVWLQLACVQMGLGRLNEAEKALSLIVSWKPKDQGKLCDVLTLRGRVKEALGKRAEALDDLAHAIQLALMSGHPEIACQIDVGMSLIGQGKRFPANPSFSREQLQKYAANSRLVQAIGLALDRPGPISLFELDQVLPIWEDCLRGKFTSASRPAKVAGWEGIVAAMAKLHLESAQERNDLPTGQRARQAWKFLAASLKPESIPLPLARKLEQLLGSAPAEPEVSIIIPLFNRLELTRQCLDSLRKHPARTIHEVILVDNGSSDGTVDFLQAEENAGRLKAILNPENVGFAKACNQGARSARGKYLLFLNNDTEVRPGWLEALVDTLRHDERVAAAGSKLLFPDGTIQHAGVAVLEDLHLPDRLVARHIHYRKPADSPETNQPRTYQALTAACLLVRRPAFEKVGGFDEGFWNGYEDVDLCFRLTRDGGLLVYQPDSVVVHHESQSGPERFRKVGANTERLHQKWLGTIQPDFIVTPDARIQPTSAGCIREYQAPELARPAARPVVSIIVAAHNQLEHTRLCFDSIREHTRLPYELLVVDNGSNDGTVEYLHSAAVDHPELKVIRNEANLGFAKSNNQALARARGDCILLLNNDTIVTAGWLEGLLAAMQHHPDVGIVGPMSNYVIGPQLVPDVTYTDRSQLRGFAAEWTARHLGKSVEASRVVGFCLLARRTVIERIGGLDEQFGLGNFEDDDFCLRAGVAGFRIRIAQSVFIHHTGSQTFKGARLDYRGAMQRNWQIFKSKWGLPAETPLEQGYRVPLKLAEGYPLKVPLADGRAKATPALVPPARPIEAPPVGHIGNLDRARSLLGQKKRREAWDATLEAIRARPFHPEAFLFLGQIAREAGDMKLAKACGERARTLVPNWKPVRKFLKNLPGNGPNKLSEWPQPPTASAIPRLTVCLIAKDEEAFIARCLRSVKGIAHQIVVVDTGSSDRTIEIAQEHGAEVFPFAWGDDFSAARNAALEKAGGDWVLMLDADEELASDARDPLRKHLSEAAVMGWRLPIVDVGREAEGCSYVPRLFRNAPGLFFIGRVHEQVFSSLETRRQEWVLENRLGTATLRHYGYSSEMTQDRRKIERNLRLLELAITEQPHDPHLLMHLGLELFRSGRETESLARYEEAFETLASWPAERIAPEFQETLLTQYATRLTANKRFQSVIDLLTSRLATAGPGLSPSLHFALGLAFMESGRFHDAAEQMERCLSKRKQKSLSPINRDILSAAPHHCLALCRAQLGDGAAADKAFREALKGTGRIEQIRLEYARFLFEQNRAVEALQQLHESISAHPRDRAAWHLGGQIALSQPEFLAFACDWTGEAMRHLADDPIVRRQRAEALLLSGRTANAAEFWNRIWDEDRQPSSLAAAILCELAEGQLNLAPSSGSEESIASKCFFDWYRRCVDAGAAALIERINSRVEELRGHLPEAARLLDAVLIEADRIELEENCPG